MSLTLSHTELDARTLTLRKRCLERKPMRVPMDGEPAVLLRALEETRAVESWPVRRGLLTRELLRAARFELDDLELLVGRLAQDTPQGAAEREAAREAIRRDYPTVITPGQTGHCQLDLSRLFALGVDGLLADLQTRAEAAGGKTGEVYRSFRAALDGLAGLVENAAAAAEAAGAGAAAQRVHELDEMAAACARVAHHPPETFHEAIQLLWLTILGCTVGDRAWLVSPGRIDRVLWPYYQADLAAGRLTPERALLLIEALYLLLNENIPDGLAIAVMVGGRDAQGADTTNALSYLCLEALRRTRLVYPTVGVCWHAGTPLALSELAVDLITQGIANPAFFGDETIQRGLQRYGVPPEESGEYINSTCVEITPVGSSNVWVASPYFSTPGILLEEIAAAAARGEENEPRDFATFLAGYQARLARRVADAAAQENNSRRARQQYGGKPLQSVFTRDCIARGRDIDDGGARYNWVECSFVGLANLADSLYVLREEVFEKRRLTLAEVHAMLHANFAGFEAERLRFLNGHAKYGNACAAVDELVERVVGFGREACARQTMLPDDSPFVPGAFCWIMHEQLGRDCGATPDGRKAGFPFADGCGPAQGRERGGPTSAARSVTSWDAAPLIGGAAFNLKFNRALFRTAGPVERLRDLILTFLEMGGFETQVNVLDAGVLKEAQANPEAYRDLVVRIGGYTDYFTRLSPQMQAEVILRTEFGEI